MFVLKATSILRLEFVVKTDFAKIENAKKLTKHLPNTLVKLLAPYIDMNIIIKLKLVLPGLTGGKPVSLKLETF